MAAEATNARMNRCWLFIRNLLHRIVTARAKWLTAKQSPNRHPRSFDRTVFLNRFACVLGTRRHKPARRWQPRRDYRFVKLQKRNQNRAHGSFGGISPSVSAGSLFEPSLTVGLLPRLSSPLGPRHLLNNPTKLSKAKFFGRTQQRSLRIDHPIVSSLERVQLPAAAPKDFSQ